MRKKSKASPSPSMTIPLQMMKSAGEEQEVAGRQLQIVITSRSTFKLPDGWSVEAKRRPLTNNVSPGQIDKYYIEPGTGLKFRSMVAVQRHLTGGTINTRTPRKKPDRESSMQITPHTSFRHSKSFVLPDGWEVEAKPRMTGKYRGAVDKTYIEPGTGHRFRSLIAVERYLTGATEDTPLKALITGANEDTPLKALISGAKALKSGTNEDTPLKALISGTNEDTPVTPLKALIPANKSSLLLCSGSQTSKNLGEIQPQKVVSTSVKINICGDKSRPSKLNFGTPPAKVNWVLAGPGGNMWNPIMDDSKVPDSVRQKWSETFISSMYGGNISAPSF